jgi:hypothetical protein
MKLRGRVFNAMLLLILAFCSGYLALAGSVYEARAAEAAGILDGCEITVIAVDFWRDWMPIVDRPGSDGGSPLRARIEFSLDNRSGSPKKLSFTGNVVDEKGQSYPVRFEVAADSGWNGSLEPGKKQVVVLLLKDGPYLPAGSLIHAEVIWADQKGVSVPIQTPNVKITRTD